jgi:hypothetical protein
MITVLETIRRGISAVGRCYQKTVENTASWEDLSACSSEL